MELVRLAAWLEAEDRSTGKARAAPTRHRLLVAGEAHPFISSQGGGRSRRAIRPPPGGQPRLGSVIGGQPSVPVCQAVRCWWLRGLVLRPV